MNKNSVLILSPIYESSYGPSRDSAINFAAEHAYNGNKVCAKSTWRGPVHESRTILAVRAAESDYDTALWVDSDNSFTPEQAIKIVNQAQEKKTIVGALYRGRDKNAANYICSANEPLVDFPGLPPTELVECDWIGFGLTAMPISVIRSMNAKYGNEMFYRNGSKGDDVAFCKNWIAMGHSVYVNAKVRIGHIGPMIFTCDD